MNLLSNTNKESTVKKGIITESWETIAQEMSLHFGRRYTSNACRFEAKRMEDKGLLVSTKEEETNAEEELSESLKALWHKATASARSQGHRPG